MFGSEKAPAAPAPAIASSFSAFLRNTWNAWDVRLMVLLSLLLQIALFVLGKRRKRTVCIIDRLILWIAYQSKDWVAIVALGKLSNSHGEHPTSNVLRALWAPLLILHLGGPDTITAYSFQDTQLWTRHILTLVAKSLLAIYVIYLSWTQFWLSLLTLPLSIAGIIKYIERIVCLRLGYSNETQWIFSGFKGPIHPSHPLLDNQESKIVFLGYAFFSAMRPDIHDIFRIVDYIPHFKVKLQIYLAEILGSLFTLNLILPDLVESYEQSSSRGSRIYFNAAVAEVGFIFDVIYTKAAFIYSKKGCFLRLLSFSCSFVVLLLFLIRITNESEFHFSRVDIFITISLLVGAVALEFGAVFSMISSNWSIIWMFVHDNCLVAKILQHVWQFFPYYLSGRKRWSSWMGQFDLFDYCWNCSKSRVYGFLERKFSNDILNNWHRFMYTKFVDVPDCLKPLEVYQERLDSFFSDDFPSIKVTRGQKALQELPPYIYSDLEWIIKVDFDTSIIAWHLATSICYYLEVGDCHPNDAPTEAMKRSKYLSDYMMYLLVMRPAMLHSENRRSLWLDHALDDIWKLFSKSSDENKRAALDSLLLKSRSELIRSASLPNCAAYLANTLIKWENKWKLIEAMWIEMLFYAAHSYQHVDNVRQNLGQYGREFLTLIWIVSGMHFVQEIMKSMDPGEPSQRQILQQGIYGCSCCVSDFFFFFCLLLSF